LSILSEARCGVGKSSLAQRLLAIDGIPWLPTDVLPTVLRLVLPELDAIDQDPVDASARQRHQPAPRLGRKRRGQAIYCGSSAGPSKLVAAAVRSVQ
jgi:hypothetical protein